MGRRREGSAAGRPYRFRQHKDRPISVEFDFMPGKRISTGSYDMAGAVLFAEDYLARQGMGADMLRVPTVAEAAKGFFSDRGPDSLYQRNLKFKRRFTESYYIQSQGLLDNYVVPAFGHLLVTAITTPMIESWLVSMKPINPKKEELADNTKNKALYAFRELLRDVKRRGFRPDNPAEGIKKIREEGEEREPVPEASLDILFPPDPDERIKVWGSIMWACYFSIFYDTGMRPGEIAALRVCDVYVSEGGLSVATDREVDKSGAYVPRVKTTGKGYSERPGLLYGDTSALLIRYIRETGKHGEDQLFPAPRTGRGLCTSTSNKRFKDTLSKHGIMYEGAVQYCMRHSYATERRGDMPDETLAISMGHTRLRDSYDHQKAKDLIRRLESSRDAFFVGRESRGRTDSIVPLEDVL